jgi:hypothetical protein
MSDCLSAYGILIPVAASSQRVLLALLRSAYAQYTLIMHRSLGDDGDEDAKVPAVVREADDVLAACPISQLAGSDRPQCFTPLLACVASAFLGRAAFRASALRGGARRSDRRRRGRKRCKENGPGPDPGMACEVYVSAPPASSMTVTAGQRAQDKVPGDVHAKSCLTLEPLRILRSETTGQAAACPDRTQAIPFKLRADCYRWLAPS